jgi:hypothetical protein
VRDRRAATGTRTVRLRAGLSNMYIQDEHAVCMPKRTTIEIDEELLARAKRG